MVVCWEARSDCAAAGMEEEEGEPARWKDDDAIAAAAAACLSCYSGYSQLLKIKLDNLVKNLPGNAEF